MLNDLKLESTYNSNDENIAEVFYNPILKNSNSFDRISAYFSAKALALYSEGLQYFGKKGNLYRLIVSKDISDKDFEEIKQGYKIKETVDADLVKSLQENLSLTEERQLSNLAYLISLGIVDIRIAFKRKGIFHDKCGIAKDEVGNVICFTGSNNETEAAVANNFESFQVTCSWLDCNGFYLSGIKKNQAKFEDLWNNKVDNIVVKPASDVVIKEIVKHSKGKLIVEDVLLQDNVAILDYNEQLMLYVNMPDMDWLLNDMFYKMRLKPKVSTISGDTVFFDSNLTYVDYLKIKDFLTDFCKRHDKEFLTTKRFDKYIEYKNLHIYKRSKLGTELKTDDVKLGERYKKFEKIVNENMSRKLRDKQMHDAFFMFAMGKSGNFSVPGSGKTASVLGVYAFLKANNLVDRIIVISPKNAFGSWIDEFKVCFEGKEKLSYFNIQSKDFKSHKERQSELKYNYSKYNLILCNYESLGSYEEEIKRLTERKTLLVFDEVHKVKRIGGEYASHALAVSKDVSYVIAMTGTPIPNSYSDIYNFLHILFNDEYDDFFGFTQAFLNAPTETEREIINDRIQPFFCRTTKDQLSVPKANEDCILNLTVSPEEQKLMEILCKKYRKNKLALFVRLLQMETNPQLLLEKLDLNEFSNILDITDEIDDIDVRDYSSDVVELINSIDLTTKKKNCLAITKKLVGEGKKVIIWCIFKNSINSIQTILKAMGIKSKSIYGEVELDTRQEIIEDFRSGNFDVLITNPHTLAESVSLHQVCHDAIYYEYSYNLIHLLQSKDRIHRLGLPSNQYTQYYYLQNDYVLDNKYFSLGSNIYDRLRIKEQIMIDAIDNCELEALTTPEEDLELIFGDLL